MVYLGEPLRVEPPSGVPARRGAAGLPEREPRGVPARERLSLSFFAFPASLRSAPERAPPSISLPDPGPPMRVLFLAACFRLSDRLTPK